MLDYPFEYEDPEDYHYTVNRKNDTVQSYWTSVPIGKKLPNNIPYVVLQEMYIPEKDPKYDNDKGEGKTRRGLVNDEVDLMNHVVEAAYVATANEDLLPEPENLKKGVDCQTCFLGVNLRKLWRPSGKIEIWDDNSSTTTTTRVFSHYEYYDCPTDNGGDGQGNQFKSTGTTAKAKCSRPVYTTRTTTTPGGGYIPLEGANVLARDTWTIASAITDGQGRFSMKRIRAKAKFLIQWDRFEFSIRDDTGVFQAEDKGPQLYDQAWNHKIKGGREQYRGHIFQAAMHFYYHDIGGLSRPPTNGFWQKQMKITAKENNEGDSFHAQQQRGGAAIIGSIFGGPVLGLLASSLTSTIRIVTYGDPSEQVYGTTIHELAHAQHWRFDKSAYNDLVEDAWIEPFFGSGTDNPSTQNADARRTLETWATGVEVFLTRMRYRRLGDSNYEYQIPNEPNANSTWGNYQRQRAPTNLRGRFYTSAVWDLVDDFDQSTFGSAFPTDNVDGFSMPSIEKAMRGSRSWNQLRDRVINEGGQATAVRELFANWN